MSYIYKIFNDINNKVYIGKTDRTIQCRWQEHLRDCYFHYNRPLYSAMRKYGTQYFHIVEIEECTREDSASREQYWIDYYQSYYNGYNATLGGDSKKILDEKMILLLWNEGLTMKQIAEKLNCCSDSVSNILHSYNIAPEEVKLRANKSIGHPIAQIDINTNEILNIFNTVADACKFLGKEHSGHFAEVCNGKRKSIYGYKWKYIEDLERDIQ